MLRMWLGSLWYTLTITPGRLALVYVDNYARKRFFFVAFRYLIDAR